MRRTFKIHRCIGKGGFGEVYLATVHLDVQPPREVAVKILRRDVDPKGNAIERLRDESRMLRAIRHPNVVQADTLTILDGRVGLVTEYVPGLDLYHLARKNPLPEGVVLEIAAAVADALWAAETTEVNGRPLDLVHRDIKPQNIRISTDGQVKLLDFGVARTDNMEREAFTADDTLLGSMPYMAPESLETARADHRTDVYALGATLFYAATGRRLFRENGQKLLIALFDPEVFSQTSRKRLVHVRHPGIRSLIARMIERDPERRPTHEEVRDQARAMLTDHGPTPLQTYLETYTWPRPKPRKGELSGRVFDEEATEPGSLVPLPPLPKGDDHEEGESTETDIWSSVRPEARTVRAASEAEEAAVEHDEPTDGPDSVPERPALPPPDPAASIPPAPLRAPPAHATSPGGPWHPSLAPTVPLPDAGSPLAAPMSQPETGSPTSPTTSGVPLNAVIGLVVGALLFGLLLGASAVGLLLATR